MSASRPRHAVARRAGHALLTLVLALGAVALAACDRPVPRVGVFAGGQYLNAEALVWCFEGQHLSGPGSCAERRGESPTIRVRVGGQVGIEVPKQVRERGWYVAIATGPDEDGEQQYQRSPIQRDTSYFSFTVPEFPVVDDKAVREVPVRVFALGDGPDAPSSGLWQFVMRNAEAGDA